MFVALILYVGSLVAAALLPGLAIPRANVVLKTAPAAFAVLILFVGSLVAVVLLPRLAIPRANVVLKTAPAAFAALILYVVSLAAVVAVILTVMMARVFPILVSNGYAL